MSTAVSIHTPDALLTLLNDGHHVHAKKAAQVFASVYSPLFRHCCNDPSSQRTWQTIERIKERIQQLFDQNAGVQGLRIAAIKAFQRIIQVQTRASSDPRSRNTDISVSMVPKSHAFLQVSMLEAEANKLLTKVVTLVFTSSNTDLVTACLNSLSLLAKARASLTKIVIEALVSWTPAALASSPYTHVRNVEKTLRLVYTHFDRNGLAGQHKGQIQEALQTQRGRMEAAARADWERRESEAKRKRDTINDELEQAEKKQRVDANAQAGPSSMPNQASQLSGVAGAEAFRRAANDESRPNPLSAFDVTSLPLQLVIELIVANLTAVTDQDMHQAIERTRSRLRGAPLPAPASSIPPPLGMGGGPAPEQSSARPAVKLEDDASEPMAPLSAPPQDPLKQDTEEEDLQQLGEQGAQPAVEVDPGAEEEVHDALAGLEDFELAPPEPYSQTEAKALIKESVARMCDQGGQAAKASAERGDAVPPQTLWATLVTRLASRGFARGEAESDDEVSSGEAQQETQKLAAPGTLAAQGNVIRQQMLDFLKDDFSNRLPFAIQWLSEEWFCDSMRRKKGQANAEMCYSIWLPKVVAAVLPTIGEKDRTLFHFLAELPALPDEVVDLVASLCHEKPLMAVGFTGLREFAVTRPPVRQRALSKLLALCRHQENTLRQAAIKTVRGWVGSAGPFGSVVLESARESLKRLTVVDPSTNGEHATPNDAGKVTPMAQDGGTSNETSAPDGPTTNGAAATNGEADDAMEEGEEEPGPPPRDPVADWSFALENESQVQQFVELPFVLSIKVPDLLDDVFAAYPAMPTVVKKGVETHIAALVRSLGPSNGNLLRILREFPPGADGLALSVFTVMAEKGRTQALVTAVKSLVSDRDNVDPHFLVPILPNLNKAEILKLLPKAVAIINSKSAEDRTTLKALFASVVTRPPQGFGSVSTNLPRVRDSDNLSPVELMGLLHAREKEIGLKTTVDAIRICFSMTDVFRSEVLAAALNQLVEEPELPVLFMRTAIMAVSTYKSLAGYVSSNLLSRLIVKKIWQNKLLWDGFVLCAEQTAPGSFAALLQLPQEQLMDVVKRKPALKEGLKAHLEKKVGNNKARLNSYLELLDSATVPGTPASNSSTPQPGEVQ